MTAVLALKAAEWGALAAWAGVLLALVAGTIAFFQLRATQRVRREQARAYVVAYMDASPAGDYVIDFVVKNFGTTAATDVVISSAPPMQRGGGDDNVELPETLPLLVPGQSWRTFWDTTIRRHESGLPEKHTVSIAFTDVWGTRQTSESVLDWRTHHRDVVTTYGLHDAAKALREIRDLMKRWNETGGGLKTVVRDGDVRDRRRREEFERRRREQEETPEADDEPPAEQPEA